MLVAARCGAAARRGPQDAGVPITLASLENRGALLWIGRGVLPAFQLLLPCWRSRVLVSFVVLGSFQWKVLDVLNISIIDKSTPQGQQEPSLPGGFFCPNWLLAALVLMWMLMSRCSDGTCGEVFCIPIVRQEEGKWNCGPQSERLPAPPSSTRVRDGFCPKRSAFPLFL